MHSTHACRILSRFRIGLTDGHMRVIMGGPSVHGRIHDHFTDPLERGHGVVVGLADAAYAAAAPGRCVRGRCPPPHRAFSMGGRGWP